MRAIASLPLGDECMHTHTHKHNCFRATREIFAGSHCARLFTRMTSTTVCMVCPRRSTFAYFRSAPIALHTIIRRTRFYNETLTVAERTDNCTHTHTTTVLSPVFDTRKSAHSGRVKGKIYAPKSNWQSCTLMLLLPPPPSSSLASSP